MKYNKGFAPILIALIIAGALIIGGGAYYLGKSSKVENKEVVNNQTQNQTQDNTGSNSHEVPTGPFLDENTYVSPEPICNTNSTPWLKIISPNGGESYKIGDSITLNWKSCNISNETPITGVLADIINPTGSNSNSRSLFCEGSDNANDLKGSDCLNNGNRIIKLSGNILPGTYKIKIASSLKKPFAEDSSDKTFTINSNVEVFKKQPGEIKYLTPELGIRWVMNVDLLSYNPKWLPGVDSTGGQYINQNTKTRNLIATRDTKMYICGNGPDGNPTTADVLSNPDDFIGNVTNSYSKIRYFDIAGINITAIYEQCLP